MKTICLLSMIGLLAYIDDEVNNSHLKEYLTELALSKIEVIQQCAYNICIDRKFGLVPAEFYERLAVKSNRLADFIHNLKEKEFFVRNESTDHRYVTVIPSNVYFNYFQPLAAGYDHKPFNVNSDFNENYIRKSGWLGYKDSRGIPIAWTTPLEELETALEYCFREGLNPSNFVFEFLGVLINKNYKEYLVTSDNQEICAMLIKYSSAFREFVFQPNCTMFPGWNIESCNNNIYLSFGSISDQFGRTFNLLFDVGPARERIHKNHFHYDNFYELLDLAVPLKFSNEIEYSRKELLTEAENRLL